MHQIVSRVHRALAWLTMAGIVVQFYLVGAALFGATSFQPHRIFGDLLAIPVLLLVIVALVGRLGRRSIGFSALLLMLVIVQALLPSLRATVPWVAALHPVNALALMAAAAAIARAREIEPHALRQGLVDRATAIQTPMPG